MSPAVAYTCQQIVDLVTEYFEDGLSDPERLAFERHVAICPPCRGYLAQLRRLSATAPALREDDLPPALRDDLLRVFAGWKAGRGPE